MTGRQHNVYLKAEQEKFRERHIPNLKEYLQRKIEQDMKDDPDTIRGRIISHQLDIDALNVRLKCAEEMSAKREKVLTENGGMDPDQQAIHEWLVEGIGTRTGQTAMNWLTGPDQEERLRKLGMSPERFLKELEASR